MFLAPLLQTATVSITESTQTTTSESFTNTATETSVTLTSLTEVSSTVSKLRRVVRMES